MREFVSDVSNYDDSPSPNPRRTKGILLIVLLVIFLLAAIVGFISYTLINKNRLELMNENSLQAISKTDLVIQNYLNAHTATLCELQNNEAIRKMGVSADSKEKLLATFDTQLKAQPDIAVIYLGTQDGRMLLQPDQELPTDYNPTDRPWYKASVVAKDPITSTPYADSTQNDVFFSLSAPVKAFDTNEVAGVLAMDISMKGFNQLINSIGFGNDGFMIVLSPDLMILSHPNPLLVGMPLNADYASQYDEMPSTERSPETERYLNQLKPLADALQNGNDFEKYRIEFKIDGRKHYAQIMKTELGWYIVSTFGEQTGF